MNMNFDTSTVRLPQPPSSVERNDTLLVTMIVLAFFLVPVLLAGAGYGYVRLFVPPSPETVLFEFQEAGLDANTFTDLDDDQSFQSSPTPKVYEQGQWFQISSLTAMEGNPAGGKVYTFESQEDMDKMVLYYESVAEMPMFGFALQSHLYEDDRRLMLLQMPATVPKDQADEYNRVMKKTWVGSQLF